MVSCKWMIMWIMMANGWAAGLVNSIIGSLLDERRCWERSKSTAMEETKSVIRSGSNGLKRSSLSHRLPFTQCQFRLWKDCVNSLVIQCWLTQPIRKSFNNRRFDEMFRRSEAEPLCYLRNQTKSDSTLNRWFACTAIALLRLRGVFDVGIDDISNGRID